MTGTAHKSRFRESQDSRLFLFIRCRDIPGRSFAALLGRAKANEELKSSMPKWEKNCSRCCSGEIDKVGNALSPWWSGDNRSTTDSGERLPRRYLLPG